MVRTRVVAMPIEENGCQETAGPVAMVTMTKSSSYMSSASSSSYSTTNTGECEVASQTAMTPGSSCLARSTAAGGGDGRPATREVHRVKFAEDLNEYRPSSRDGLDDGSDIDDRLGRPLDAGEMYDDVDAEEDAEGCGFQRSHQHRVIQRPSIIKQPRPRSPEEHDNPFTADGELQRKADYILRFSTISRRRIRIADPDCIPEKTESSTDSTTATPGPDVVSCPSTANGSCSPPGNVSTVSNGSPPGSTSNGGRRNGVGRNGSPTTAKERDVADVVDVLVMDGHVAETQTAELLDRPTIALLCDQRPEGAGSPRHSGGDGRLRYNCCALQ